MSRLLWEKLAGIRREFRIFRRLTPRLNNILFRGANDGELKFVCVSLPGASFLLFPVIGKKKLKMIARRDPSICHVENGVPENWKWRHVSRRMFNVASWLARRITMISVVTQGGRGSRIRSFPGLGQKCCRKSSPGGGRVVNGHTLIDVVLLTMPPGALQRYATSMRWYGNLWDPQMVAKVARVFARSDVLFSNRRTVACNFAK